MKKLVALYRVYWYYYKSERALDKVFTALDRNDFGTAEKYEKRYVKNVNKANSCDQNYAS